MMEVLLVGNPNCGKTTLFNSLTCSNEHVGNWHGVTVDTVKKSFSYNEKEYLLVDTPGLYSLSPLSFEEEVASKEILSGNKKIINLCDQNNLRRNLYLTLCLLEKGCDIVVAINQIDKKNIYKIDASKLSQILGVPVIMINAEKKINLDGLKDSLSHEKQTKKLGYTLFGDEEQKARIRYEFIDKILSETTQKTSKVYGQSKVDKILLNKWLCFPCFLVILATIFYLTFFSLGAFLSDVLSNFLTLLTTPILNFIKNSTGSGFLFDMFNYAIFGGISTVLSFLPQVVLLFFFLSILEDTGYMARIAFVFDDILGKIGLSGKSIYTLLMGFGCSTSAIMTSRNMSDKNAKIKTAMICPYMSCSAKIPIYTVVGGVFFGAKNIFVIMGLYLLGIFVSIVVSKILDVSVLKSKSQSFILEFPPFRSTSMARVFKILWKNTKEFLIKVGSIMISMNIIIWVLSSFSFSFKYLAGESGSILESIGKFLSPIFVPLGFGNWAIVSALLAGLVAKEVVVSSIAMFNGIDASASKLISSSLLLPTSLVYFQSKASVLSFLVFCLLYVPCMASISMLIQEIGKKWTFISIIVQLTSAYLVALIVYNIAFALEIGFYEFLYIVLAILVVAIAGIVVYKHVKNKKCCHNCGSCDKNCRP